MVSAISSILPERLKFKATIVQLILNKQPEEAIDRLSAYYKISPPKLKIGRVKGHHKSLAVYLSTKKTIFTSNQICLFDPRIILHEYYHHLRSREGKHKGNEKYADKFAQDFIAGYNVYIAQAGKFRKNTYMTD